MSRSFRWNICGRVDDGPKQKRNEKGSESRIVASCNEAGRDAYHCAGLEPQIIRRLDDARFLFMFVFRLLYV